MAEVSKKKAANQKKIEEENKKTEEISEETDPVDVVEGEDVEAKIAEDLLKDIESDKAAALRSRKAIEELMEKRRLQKELDYLMDEWDDSEDKDEK